MLGTTIEIPSGANYLFVSTLDWFFQDNQDTNNDLGIKILYFGTGIRVKLLQPTNPFIISPEPKMPVVLAVAEVVGLTPAENARTNITWNVSLRAKDGTAHPIDYDSDIKQEVTLKGNKSFNVEFKDFRGGEINITAKAKKPNGLGVVGNVISRIEGRNPTRQEVRDYIDRIARDVFGKEYKDIPIAEIQNVLKKMACHESEKALVPGQRQFNGLPGRSWRSNCVFAITAWVSFRLQTRKSVIRKVDYLPMPSIIP